MSQVAAPDFLTVAQVCARLNLSEKTVRKRIAAGKIPAEKTPLSRGGFAYKIGRAWVESETGTASGTELKVEPERKQNGNGTELFAVETQTGTQATGNRNGSGTEGIPNAAQEDFAARYVTQIEAENRFLKLQIEEGNRNAAELRAALRKALDNAPRALTSGAAESAPSVPESRANRGGERNHATRQNGPERSVSYDDIADYLDRILGNSQ